MSDTLDMTGMWEGSYVYPGYQGPTTPFVANLVEEGGQLSGGILEPDLLSLSGGAGELEARIVGARDGAAVDFTKTYLGPLAHEKIDYVGKLSGDGTLVTGVWSNGLMDGTFEMRRERGWDEVIAAREEEEVEISVAPPPSVE